MRAWGPDRRDELAQWISVPSANAVSRISASAQKRGRPGPANDTWIAAT
jgi:predicted nucleic acid-binding protein